MKKKMILLFILASILTAVFAQETFQIPSFKAGDAIEYAIKKTMGTVKYKVTPGDIYQLIISVANVANKGNSDIVFAAVVTDKYEMEIPYLGTMKVKGLYYYDLRDLVIQRVKTQISAVYIDFKLISPGLFDVFIYGSIKTPGFLTATSLSRASDILAQAGITEFSSFRIIQLSRGDNILSLDLIKYLTEGDLSQNPLLEPGDKIFVPIPKIVCQIQGMVVKSGRYEILEGETLLNLIKFSGGILPGGSLTDIWITRTETENNTQVYAVKYAEAGGFLLKNGDMVNIKANLENKRTILVEGALYGEQYKGNGIQAVPRTPLVLNLPYITGMTLLSVLEATGGPTPFANPDKSVIIRENSNERIPVNVKQLWETKDKSLDLELQTGDHIFIPMQDLKIVVAGHVNAPGAFPYTTEAKVGDYLLFAGGVNPDTGSINQLYKLESTGRKTRLGLNDPVEPGTIIFVDKNSWNITTKFLSDVGIIVGFSTAVVTLGSAIIELVNSLK